jgi:hypothetical protein
MAVVLSVTDSIDGITFALHSSTKVFVKNLVNMNTYMTLLPANALAYPMLSI